VADFHRYNSLIMPSKHIFLLLHFISFHHRKPLFTKIERNIHTLLLSHCCYKYLTRSPQAADHQLSFAQKSTTKSTYNYCSAPDYVKTKITLIATCLLFTFLSPIHASNFILLPIPYLKFFKGKKLSIFSQLYLTSRAVSTILSQFSAPSAHLCYKAISFSFIYFSYLSFPKNMSVQTPSL
jgi:hypothetical protein